MGNPLLSIGRYASKAASGGLAPVRKFKVFQRFFHTGLPSTATFQGQGIGFAREYYSLSGNNQIVEANVESGINGVFSAGADIWFADIESSFYSYTVAGAAVAVPAHQNIHTWARAQQPTGKYGIYGGGNGLEQITTGANLYTAANLATIQADNNACLGIANTADYLTLYAYNLDNIQRWQNYVNQALTEYTRLGLSAQPLYAFIQMYYAPGAINGSGLIDAAYWRAMLEYLYRQSQCAGVLIWGGTGHSWTGTDPWWLETLSFISDYKISYSPGIS